MASISDHSSLRTVSRTNSSSPRGHISPLHEASRLLSPVQLHRDFPVQERVTPTIVEHVEDGNETQPSLSSFPAPSNPNSLQEGKDARSTSFRRATHWKTVGMIIGSLFAGQSAHARERTPLTLRSPSFRFRALLSVQESGRQAHRHKLLHAVPNVCRRYPLDNHLQSRADGEYRDLLCAAPLVYPPWKCHVAISNREVVCLPHQHIGVGRPAQYLEGTSTVSHGSLDMVSRNRDYLSPGCADRYVRGT
jgi:hypothetical protein